MSTYGAAADTTVVVQTVELVEHYEISVDVSASADPQWILACQSSCLTAAADWSQREGIEIELTPFAERLSVGVRWTVSVGRGGWDAHDADAETGRWAWSARWRYWADYFRKMAQPKLSVAGVTRLRVKGSISGGGNHPGVELLDLGDESGVPDLRGPIDDGVRLEDVYCNRCGSPHVPGRCLRAERDVEPWHGKAGSCGLTIAFDPWL